MTFLSKELNNYACLVNFRVELGLFRVNGCFFSQKGGITSILARNDKLIKKSKFIVFAAGRDQNQQQCPNGQHFDATQNACVNDTPPPEQQQAAAAGAPPP
jgi:hypothetical protein